MAWTAYVKLDSDKDAVGIAAVVWNEGLPDEFRYQRRAALTLAEASLIRVEAEAALAQRGETTTREGDLSGILEGVMNG